MTREETIEKRQKVHKKQIIEQLKKTPVVETVCQKVGIGRSTYYRWRKADSDFAEATDKALFEGKLRVNDLAESRLLGKIRESNLSAIKFWLRNHHKTYAKKLNITGDITHSKKELSDKQKATIKKALRLTSAEGENNDQPDHE